MFALEAEAVSKPPFTHLHVHTQYSLLDGAARLKDMFNACNEMGMTHIAMQEALDGNYATWMEKVTDAEYAAKVG